MTVTAVVCVRNGALRLGRALDSIRRQRRQPDEVLVVDGRSTDATADLARRWGARVIRQDGTGLADARNLALQRSRGEFVAFLDHDDRWTEDKLALQSAALHAAAGSAYAAAHLRFVADDEAGSAIPGLRGEARLGRTPGTLLARRSVFERVGPFAVELGIGCDMDWFARADLAGCRPIILAEVLLLKTLRADALSADPARNREAAFAVIARRLRERRG